MNNRYIIITGASSGLGYEIAKLLDEKGKNLILVGRDLEKLELLQGELENESIVEMCHISSQSIKAYKEYEIEGLFNVAGYGAFGKVENLKTEEILSMINSNLLGLINVTRDYVKYIKTKNERGKIVSVLSTAALKGKENESVYCASKWGARGFIEALKIELKGQVEFVTVFPGGIQTPFWKDTEMNVEKFMKAQDVAKHIVDAYMEENIVVEEIVLNRK